MTVPASVSDYRLLAERRLPRPFFDYIDGGAYNELTLAASASCAAPAPSTPPPSCSANGSPSR
jgi:hypothetical protein